MASSPMFWVAAIACIAVLGILVLGIASFTRGGDFNRKNANKLMRLRLVAQFVAVILILVFVTWFKEGG